MHLALWLSTRWRLPATPAFSLPVAVSLKRFFTPDLVFSFGISRRSGEAPSYGRIDEPPWHAIGQAAPKGAADTPKPAGRQGDGTVRRRSGPAGRSAGRARRRAGSARRSAGEARRARPGRTAGPHRPARRCAP